MLEFVFVGLAAVWGLELLDATTGWKMPATLLVTFDAGLFGQLGQLLFVPLDLCANVLDLLLEIFDTIGHEMPGQGCQFPVDATPVLTVSAELIGNIRQDLVSDILGELSTLLLFGQVAGYGNFPKTPFARATGMLGSHTHPDI